MDYIRNVISPSLAVILLVAVLGCAPEEPEAGAPGAVESTLPAADFDVDPDRPYLTRAHRDLGPAAVISRIRQVAAKRRLTFPEQFDHGSALLQQGRCAEAAVAYEAAAGQAGDDRLRALAYLMAAQAAALTPADNEHVTATEASRRAGELANRAQRFAPGSAEVAGYRYGYWSAAGDELEAAAANALVRRRDLQVDGAVVLEPATVAVMVGVTAGILTIWAYEEGLLSQEQATVLITTAITVVLNASQRSDSGEVLL